MTKNNSNDNRTTKDDAENKGNEAANKDDKNKTPTTESSNSGDPGRTPGAAEGDEQTVDEDIREKEAEGKL